MSADYIVLLTFGAFIIIVAAVLLSVTFSSNDSSLEKKLREAFGTKAFTLTQAITASKGASFITVSSLIKRLVENNKLVHLEPDNRLIFLDRYQFLT